ncbi:hypothetical protein O3609_03360 [Veillonella atypica]|uniref:hypothetical protein n=1 Tax=Veillonella atypica TaxID=39777 RepID=UPI00352EC7A7
MEMVLAIISFVIGLFISSKFNVIGFGSDAREAIGNGCGAFLGLWVFSAGIVYAILAYFFL